jgi:hypothetical protein
MCQLQKGTLEVCLDTRGIGKLDGTSTMSRVGIPYVESYTLAIIKVGVHKIH